MSDAADEGAPVERMSRRAPYVATDEQRRKNMITLLVIMFLVAAMIATAIILPNLAPR